MALNQNQFGETTVQGVMDGRVNPSTFEAQIDTTTATAATGLVAGQPVKLVASAGGIPKVVECTADTDDVWGFMNYSFRKANAIAGEKISASAFRGNVMYMTASGAIPRGSKVMIVITGIKVAVATSGKTIVGRALDQAAADGDLIRVYIDLPGTLA